jgi:hypothetical protein
VKNVFRVAGIAVTGALLVVGAVVVVPKPAEAAAQKVTICHRTRALTNPYRRITVNFTAANGGGQSDHQGHTGAAFDPAVHNASNKTWGDVIPDSSVHGLNQVSAVNWDARGQAIFNGTGSGAGLCGKMTAARFLEIATDANDGWLTQAQALAELDEMADNEDKVLLRELGVANFAAVTNVSTLSTAALSVTTSAATSVTAGAAVLNGTHSVGGQSAGASFQYGSDSSCATGTIVSASSPTVTGSASMTASLSNLAAGTYHFKALATIGAGTDDEAVFEGACLSFTVSSSSGGGSSSSVPDNSSGGGSSSGGSSSGGSSSGGSSSTGSQSSSGGSSSSGSTTSGGGGNPGKPSDPANAGPASRPKGTTAVTQSLSLSPTPNQGGGGGSLAIDPGTNGPGIELQGATTDDPNVEIVVTASGSDYNKPETWVREGFGDVCWKIEPFGDTDYVYTLPATPTPPSGSADGMTYSMVKVKAGSIRSTDPDFQVNTIFSNPAGGTGVFADSNKSGTSDPGGRTGDKSISHVIVCVWVDGPPSESTATTAAPTTAAPGDTTPTTAAPTTAAPTTAAPGDTTPTTAAPTTAAPSTAAPTTAAPTTATPTTQPPAPRDPVVITLRLRDPDPTTTAVPTTAAPSTETPATTAAPTTTAPTGAGSGSTDTTTTAPATDESTDDTPIPTLTPQTRIGTSKVVMLLSTGSETIQVEIEVDMASFEVVSSPVPELVLPATGSRSFDTTAPIAATALIAGLLAVVASRRRFI